MAPHSRTLAWKIPWTEEPGRLQSMGYINIYKDRMVEDIGGESRQFVDQELDSCFSPTISCGFLGSPQASDPTLRTRKNEFKKSIC